MPSNIIIPEFKTPTEEKDTKADSKKDEKKTEKVSISQTFVEKFFDNIFKSIAIVGGSHWNLTKEECKDLAVCGKPVIEKHFDKFLEWFAEITLVLCLVRILISKGKISWAIENEKKKKLAEHELNKAIETKVEKIEQKRKKDYPKSHADRLREQMDSAENATEENTEDNANSDDEYKID